MRAIFGCAAAVLTAAFTTQSFSPQPFERFTPGTVAQDLAVTPKGGWTYIVGPTSDPNYPTTPDAFDRTCGTDGACNVFQGRFGPVRLADVVLTVFDHTGEIRYSTFLGGAGQDDNPRLAIARDGTLWLAGNTTSPAFEKGPPCGGNLWIARFDYTLQRIDFFMCMNGTVSDIALEPGGLLWVLGITGSAPIIATPRAFQPNVAGQLDMFVARISPMTAIPLMATHIGGDRLDIGSDIAITPTGDVAIVGETNSTNFPLVRPLKTVPPSSVVRGDAVILVIDQTGGFLEFSTYWGGSADDSASAVSVDATGRLFVTGQTASPDMPATEGAFDVRCEGVVDCRDAYVVRLNAVGELEASTFLGGSGLDGGDDIAVRPNGQVIVMGHTQSPDFPLVGGQPFQRWRPSINFGHTWFATFDQRLERISRSAFVGSESLLPSVARFIEWRGFAYVSGQVTTSTGAPTFGNYLAAVPVP